MARNDEKQISYEGPDKLLELLEKIPDKDARKEILSMFHNAIVEHPHAHIMILDKNGIFLFQNYSIHGISPEQFIGLSYLSTFEGKINRKEIEYLDGCFKDALQGKKKSYEVELLNGKKYLAIFIPVEKNGEVSYVIIAANEITHEKEVEKLKKTKQLYEERVKDFFAMRIRYPDGVCEYVSPSFKYVTGWELKEGLNGYSLLMSKLHPDSREEIEEAIKKLKHGITTSELIFKVKHKNKGYRWLHQTNSEDYDKNGNLIAIECIVKDITEQKEIEDKFKDLEEKFTVILKEGKVALCTVKCDTKSPSLFFSESIENILGYDAKDFFDDPELWIKVAHAKDFSTFVEQYNLQLKTGDEINLTGRFIRKDGFICKLKIWGKIFRDSEGKPLRSECIFMDISDKDVYDELLDYFAQKIAEDELKKKSNEKTYIR